MLDDVMESDAVLVNYNSKYKVKEESFSSLSYLIIGYLINFNFSAEMLSHRVHDHAFI